jgi:hypothetical protein
MQAGRRHIDLDKSGVKALPKEIEIPEFYSLPHGNFPT